MTIEELKDSLNHRLSGRLIDMAPEQVAEELSAMLPDKILPSLDASINVLCQTEGNYVGAFILRVSLGKNQPFYVPGAKALAARDAVYGVMYRTRRDKTLGIDSIRLLRPKFRDYEVEVYMRRLLIDKDGPVERLMRHAIQAKAGLPLTSNQTLFLGQAANDPVLLDKLLANGEAVLKEFASHRSDKAKSLLRRIKKFEEEITQ